MLGLSAITACSDVQQIFEEGAKQGAAEGALQPLGRLAVEQIAQVKLTDDLECEAHDMTDGRVPVTCTGQTQDGDKVALEASVTSTDLEKGAVRGRFTIVINGRTVTELDCVGIC